MPATVTPEAVARKVITEASRWRSSATVRARLPLSAPSSATPASVATSGFGNPVNRATSVEPKQPTTR